MSFIATLISAMFAGDLVWWYRADRWLRRTPRAKFWRWLVGVFSFVEIAGLAVTVLARTENGPWEMLLTRPFLAAIFLWHLVILPFTLLFWISTSILLLPVWIVQWRRRRQEKVQPRPFRYGMSRREFLTAGAASAPALLTIGATAFALPQLKEFRIRRLEIPIPNLPGSLDGLTIAQVSDMHVGRFTKGEVLDRIVAETNALEADLVLLTGDLINYEIEDLPAALNLVLAMDAAHGVFMCEGNHDLIEDPKEFVQQTRAAGVNLLVNEAQTIEIRGEPVQLLGLQWGAPRRQGTRAVQHGDGAIAESMKELLKIRDPAAFPILLAHHPHAFDFATELPLTLSGHTHGGQLMLNERLGAGPAIFRYWSGLYHSGGRTLMVSNGVGNWFPLRTMAPAEIVHLTLRNV